MNPDEIIQLALVGIQSLVTLIGRVQANHQMSDAQLDAYINMTSDQTRAMVQKFLASMPTPAPVVKVPVPAGDSGSHLQGEFIKARLDELNQSPAPAAPDAMTGSE